MCLQWGVLWLELDKSSWLKERSPEMLKQELHSFLKMGGAAGGKVRGESAEWWLWDSHEDGSPAQGTESTVLWSLPGAR